MLGIVLAQGVNAARLFLMNLDDIAELAENPEYQSIEEFVTLLMDDDRKGFTHLELRALAMNLKVSGNKLRGELESYGLSLEVRPVVRRTRGFTANSHDRWVNSGCHGGSGGDQITGFAGRNG